MPKSLQAIGNDALQKVPAPLQRVLHGLNVQFGQENGPVSAMAGGTGPGNPSVLAGVQQGSPNRISVMNPDSFAKNAPQLVAHEGMHLWQNNLPPALQAKIPQDDPNNPYQVASTDKVRSLLNQGKNILSLPKEQESATMQYYQAQGGDQSAPKEMQNTYGKLGQTMNAIPQSQIDMTDPNAKEINTHPRAPLPPIMNYAQDTYQKGQPAPGDDYSQQTMVASHPRGLVAAGNLPIWNRPTIQNANGSHSSELSFSREDNGKEVLVPSIVSGKFMTPDGKMPPLGSQDKSGKYIPTPEEKAMQDRAWQHYENTGENLGKFANPDDADAYANVLHNRGGYNYGTPSSIMDPTSPLASALNTHPRAPLAPPPDVPGMNYATDTYQKGQPAPGDDPYAAYANKPATEDPYASYANQASTPEQPEDDRNAFQKRVDSATSTPSTSGPRWLDAFGRRTAQNVLAPVAHPLQTLQGVAASTQPTGYEGAIPGGGELAPLVMHGLKGLYDSYKQGGLPSVLGDVAGGTILGELTGGALRGAAEPVGNLLKSGGAKLDNAVLGSTVGDMQRGANPGAGLSQNRIWGFSQNKLLGDINKRVPEVTAENRDILAQANPNIRINRSDAIAQPFNDEIGSATDPMTGAAMPSQISKALKTRNSLLNELDPTTGAITTGMRDPFVSPLQAAQLKSNIYKMTDYDNPSRSAFSNNALKGSAHNLKDAIETAVPESQASGQNLHNLMSAKDLLQPRVLGTRAIPASREALLSHAVTGLGTGVGSLMDAAGAGGLNLARILRAPLLAPGLGAGTYSAIPTLRQSQ